MRITKTNLHLKWPVIDDDSGILARSFNRLQHWMLSSRLKYPFLLCWGQLGGFFPIFPDKSESLQVVFGDPIKCKKLSPADPFFDTYVKHIANDYYNQQEMLSENDDDDKKRRGMKKE